MNIVNDILVNTLFPDTDFVQTLSMNSVVPKYVENQEKGNPSVCKNCAEAPFNDLHIYGRSEQMTTTGAQLLDLDAINLATGGGATIKRLDDGGFLVDGTPKKAYEQYTKKIAINLAPGTYFVSGGRYEDGCAVAQINILNADGTKKYKSNASFDVLGTEQGITLVIQSISEKPINNYKIYPMINSGSVALPFEPYTGGKPSPSPDYQQEIINSGNNGSLDVTLHGKNLIDYKTIEYTQKGWEGKHSVSNNVLTISAVRGWTIVAFKSPVSLGEKVSLSFKYRQVGGTSGDCSDAFCITSDHEDKYPTNVIYRTNHPSSEWTDVSASFFSNEYIAFFMRVDKEGGEEGTSRIIEIIDVQLEVGNQSTEYEPYRIPQTLSIETPNGLPGIPVSSGGNYTDENGQQWICDEVDLGRGVYRQRIKHVNAVFKKRASSSTHSGYRHIADNMKNMSREHKECLCNIATYSETASNGTEGIRANGEYNTLVLYYENLTNDNVSADVAYILSDPIETPLTAAEIAAYKSLRTYRGTTIVEAEDKAGIFVKYNMPMPKLSKNGALRRWFKRHPII